MTAVTSTRIYCRPSCPARTPGRGHVRFYPSAAGAQRAGFRACKRCRPDASPGSPEWNVRQDAVARAMRMIGEGVVDREGVAGLAARLAYSPRQLNRLLLSEVGAGPLALARAQRAQTARVLVETTELPGVVGGVRGRLRQRPAVQRHDPARLRLHPDRAAPQIQERLERVTGHPEPAPGPPPPLRRPRHHVVPGAQSRPRGRGRHGDEGSPGRSPFPMEAAPSISSPPDDHVRARLRLDDLRDLTPAVQRCRRLLDLDADPVAVDDQLKADPVLGHLAHRVPGLRVPGCVDPHELAVRAVVGQQVSVPSARRVLGRLVAEHGDPGVGPARRRQQPP